MKKIVYYAIISCLAFIFGLFLYIANQHIIILKPFATQTLTPHATVVSKKKVMLYFRDNDAWKHEQVDIIWSEDMSKTIEYLINAWLSLLEEEKTKNKKISLQSIALSPSGQEAFISFDRNPFDKKSSTYEKWLWAESLLKTLRDNNIPLKFVQLLTHHQPITDYHIDFSKPWPMEGFL